MSLIIRLAGAIGRGQYYLLTVPRVLWSLWEHPDLSDQLYWLSFLDTH
jgi:hypothetical protein